MKVLSIYFLLCEGVKNMCENIFPIVSPNLDIIKTNKGEY